MSNKTNKIIFKKLVLSSSRLPESVLAAERERIKQGVSPETMAKAEKDFESLPNDMKQKFYRTFGGCQKDVERTNACKALAEREFSDEELEQIKKNLKPLPEEIEKKFNRTFGKD